MDGWMDEWMDGYNDDGLVKKLTNGWVKMDK